jgi:hypothetical protein
MRCPSNERVIVNQSPHLYHSLINESIPLHQSVISQQMPIAEPIRVASRVIDPPIPINYITSPSIIMQPEMVRVI